MKSRFEFKPGGSPLVLPVGHAALTESRTLFPSRVRSAREVSRVLIPGEFNSKIGGQWEKWWPGVRIYTLSLEERATCPRSCPQWASCYGNRQRFTIRVQADDDLIPRLAAELPVLLWRHGRVSIRLHQLGDFHSVAYARFWVDQVERLPGLHLFGFTARPRTSPIGRLIDQASREWDRVRIRFSNDNGPRSARAEDKPERGTHSGWTTCPAITGDARKCESCGLCLALQSQITFGLH